MITGLNQLDFGPYPDVVNPVQDDCRPYHSHSASYPCQYWYKGIFYVEIWRAGASAPDPSVTGDPILVDLHNGDSVKAYWYAYHPASNPLHKGLTLSRLKADGTAEVIRKVAEGAGQLGVQWADAHWEGITFVPADPQPSYHINPGQSGPYVDSQGGTYYGHWTANQGDLAYGMELDATIYDPITKKEVLNWTFTGGDTEPCQPGAVAFLPTNTYTITPSFTRTPTRTNTFTPTPVVTATWAPGFNNPEDINRTRDGCRSSDAGGADPEASGGRGFGAGGFGPAGFGAYGSGPSNPVLTAWGIRYLDNVDFSAPGKAGLDFSFERHFFDARPLRPGPLGLGWSHNWDLLLTLGDPQATLRFSDGHIHRLQKLSATEYQPLDGFNYRLLQRAGVWHLVGKDGRDYAFNADGTLDNLSDRFGNQIRCYYSNGKLSQITDSAGRIYTLTYDPGSGLLSSFQMPQPDSGGLLSYTYTQVNGYLTHVEGPGSGNDGYKADYGYDTARGLLTSKKDPRSKPGYRHMRYVYDEGGRLTDNVRLTDSGSDAFGAAASHLVYRDMPGGGLEVDISEDGYTRTIVFSADRTWIATRINGVEAPRQWGPQNQGLGSSSDYEGHTTTYTWYLGGEPGYVGHNRSELKSSLDAAGLLTEYKYDAYGFGQVQERKETDTHSGRVRTWSAVIDSLGRTTSIDAYGEQTSYVYGPEGMGAWTERTGPDQVTHKRSFYSNGLVHTEQNLKTGVVLTYVYDNWGRVHSRTDSGTGLTATYSYDGDGHALGVTYSGDGGSSSESASYDGWGRLTGSTDERGASKTYIYATDGSDDVESLNGPGGLYQIGYHYNNKFEVDRQTLNGPDGLGGSVDEAQRYTYVQANCCGAQGKLQSRTQEGAQVGALTMDLTTTYDYDNDGRLWHTYSPEPGHDQELKYDVAGRLSEQILGTGAESRKFTFGYNAFGWRKSLTDAKLQTTTFSYDDHGRMIGEQPPEGQALTTHYQVDGKLDYKVDRLGRTWDLGYDPAGHLSYESFAGLDGTTLRHDYEYGGPGRSPDQLAAVTDASGRVEFDYGHKSQVTEERHLGFDRKLHMHYEAGGRPDSFTLSTLSGQDSQVLERHYDALGRVDWMTDWAGNKLVYGYDAANRLRRTEFNAKRGLFLRRIATGRYDYDKAGRLLNRVYRRGSSATGGVLARVDYDYDKAGNRTARKTLANQASYAHNTLNELITDANSADSRGDQGFVYDKAGNRDSQTFSNAADRTYDHSNALNQTESYSGLDAASFQYDAEGNRLSTQHSALSTQYAWDGKNRLGRVTLPGGDTVVYTYDYTNHRVRRVQEAETRQYLYHGNEMIEETLNGQRVALYAWDGQSLATRISADGNTLFYLLDGLGSTLALMDDRGEIVQNYEYSAFGECLSGKDAVNAFRFVGGFGGQTDDATGLVYFWNRWLDPQTGRWLSEDPIRHWGGVNLYGYVSNRPAVLIDRLGLLEEISKEIINRNGGEGVVSNLENINSAWDAISTLLDRIFKQEEIDGTAGCPGSTDDNFKSFYDSLIEFLNSTGPEGYNPSGDNHLGGSGGIAY